MIDRSVEVGFSEDLQRKPPKRHVWFVMKRSRRSTITVSVYCSAARYRRLRRLADKLDIWTILVEVSQELVGALEEFGSSSQFNWTLMMTGTDAQKGVSLYQGQKKPRKNR